MTFGYHNHIIEFGKENGVVFFDELLKRTDPKSGCLRDGLRLGGRAAATIRLNISANSRSAFPCCT